MEIEYTPIAKEHLDYWRKSGNKRIQRKITELFQSILHDPFSGIGKPEPLKHDLSRHWSRRINKEHRLVYRLEGNKIIVVSLRYHYH